MVLIQKLISNIALLLYLSDNSFQEKFYSIFEFIKIELPLSKI